MFDNKSFKVNDKVKIKVKENLPLSLRNDTIGIITNINGNYINVRLNKSKITFELYPCELEKLRRVRKWLKEYTCMI